MPEVAYFNHSKFHLLCLEIEFKIADCKQIVSLHATCGRTRSQGYFSTCTISPLSDWVCRDWTCSCPLSSSADHMEHSSTVLPSWSRSAAAAPDSSPAVAASLSYTLPSVHASPFLARTFAVSLGVHANTQTDLILSLKSTYAKTLQ